MKRLCVFLLLGCSFVFSATQKPYEGTKLFIAGTEVNGNGVRLIRATGIDGARFLLTCNNDDSSCTAPALKQLYWLNGAMGGYKCDTYILRRVGPDERILVCLQDVN